MVGNDVVDLRDRESDPATLHPRFDARVFDASEREALARSDDPDTLRWQLWAAKEAAYKAVKKTDPRTVFSPARFRVALEPAAASRQRGVVVRSDDCFDVDVETRDGVVHAVARSSPPAASGAPERVVYGVLRMPADGARDPAGPGRVARSFSRERLAPLFDASPDELEIRKRGRVPEVWLRGARAGADLSLSHHGDVVAFACALPRVATGTSGGAE